MFEFADVAVFDGGSDGGFAVAGDDEATRDEFVAWAFFDVVGFAGDEGFVDFDDSLFDGGVDEDLVAEAEDHEISLDEVFRANLDGFVISNNSRVLLGEKFHLVDGAFGADFVDDGDESVGDGDKDEEEVFIRADDENHRCEDEVDEVEDRESVFRDDFPISHSLIIALMLAVVRLMLVT